MRYLGGKSRQASRIVQCILERETIETWVEPFLGGGSVAVAAVPHVQRMRLSDSNRNLVEMWRIGVQGWEPPDLPPTKEQYERLRRRDAVDGLLGFVSVGASFNGKVWDTYAPTSGKRNYWDETRRRFINDCSELRRCPDLEIDPLDYQLSPDGTLYCDPPYADVTSYGAVAEFDSRTFWDWAGSRPSCYVSEFTASDGWTSVLAINRSTTIDASTTKRDVEHLWVRTNEVRATPGNSPAPAG